MSLRLRLIVAFFLLSVVPLGALTMFSYASNAHALRQAAGRETELLAGELSQRMEGVTNQLSERVGYLMDVAQARADATAAVSQQVKAAVLTAPDEQTIAKSAAIAAQEAQS